MDLNFCCAHATHSVLWLCLIVPKQMHDHVYYLLYKHHSIHKCVIR